MIKKLNEYGYEASLDDGSSENKDNIEEIYIKPTHTNMPDDFT